MGKYVKTNSEQSLELFCLECDQHVYHCDGCREYFEPGSVIYCEEKSVNGYHLCEDCKEEEYS